MKLPRSVQEIADVIGRERTLFLIGQLPKCYVRDGSERVMLYVPKNLKPDHHLVRILGWHEAKALVDAFPGALLCPGNCREVYRRFRDYGFGVLQRDGVPIPMIAEWFGVTERRVRQVLEITQQERKTPANDNAPSHTLKHSAQHERKRGANSGTPGESRFHVGRDRSGSRN